MYLIIEYKLKSYIIIIFNDSILKKDLNGFKYNKFIITIIIIIKQKIIILNKLINKINTICKRRSRIFVSY